jgi:hypothetical protein
MMKKIKKEGESMCRLYELLEQLLVIGGAFLCALVILVNFLFCFAAAGLLKDAVITSTSPAICSEYQTGGGNCNEQE